MRIYQVHTFVADQTTEGRRSTAAGLQTKVPLYIAGLEEGVRRKARRRSCGAPHLASTRRYDRSQVSMKRPHSSISKWNVCDWMTRRRV